jgi:aryl-alcohol dehydrogenase-like predicted oxidoreductase
MQLARARLGHSDLEITRVGVGTAPIGSTPEWRINWGPQDEGDAIRAIQTAVDAGVNWIDTAPFYGWGRAERLVGEALAGRREQVYLFTKCGTMRDDGGGWHDDLSPASIRREIEASLRHLRTDHVDLYQFHDPDPAMPIERSWGTMQELIAEGKVRWGGLSNHPPELVARALTVGPVAALQEQYSLLHREIERDVLPFAERHDVGVLAWSPLASGFLTDGFRLERLDPQDFRRRHPFAQEPAYARLVRVRAGLSAIASARGRTLAELAIAWVLRMPALTGAIMGIRNAHEARAMTAALDWRLSDEEVRAIEQVLTGWNEG